MSERDILRKIISQINENAGNTSETIRVNDYCPHAKRYAPYKDERMEYEDPVSLMKELIFEQEEVFEGLKKLYLHYNA